MASETVEVPTPAAADGDYVLRLRGDSMVDAGMLDGDYLVVKTTDSAMDGEIVVAEVDGAMTVKRWRLDADGAPWLEAANAEVEPVCGVDVRVVGRVVGLFRDRGAGGALMAWDQKKRTVCSDFPTRKGAL